ncbi:serine kinase [Variovorax paradoxus]|uniref:serine kinase n=1 Tax=Variovorax paradoxus TaxID=34073 RepID=UPI0024805263|nr:serine kinase [Variovorax paradoxus]WGT65942.1 serine kinase [Variovorax paradoxus]
MSIDWKLLADVRERQKTVAMGVVARDRVAAEQSQARLMQAEALREQQQENKLRHWEATRGALSGGQCSVAEFRSAGAWSGALDARIAQAGEAAAQAARAHSEREQVLEQSRRQLRAAHGELEKAQQMQQRARMERMHLRELRLEDINEETTAQAWAMRRPA